jgi:hypothetical protein
VLVEELGHRVRGAAGDLGEGAGGVVVLAGQDRPLAGDEQLGGPGGLVDAVVGALVDPQPGSPKARRALPGSRTSAATASPRASRPRTTWLPTRPVAPITAVLIVSPLR